MTVALDKKPLGTRHGCLVRNRQGICAANRSFRNQHCPRCAAGSSTDGDPCSRIRTSVRPPPERLCQSLGGGREFPTRRPIITATQKQKVCIETANSQRRAAYVIHPVDRTPIKCRP